MITAASVKGKIQGLIDKANETTGNTDTDLTTAVNALVEGYGQGGDNTGGDGLKYDMGEFVLDADTHLNLRLYHNLGEVPDVLIVWTDAFKDLNAENVLPYDFNAQVGYVFLKNLFVGLTQALTTVVSTHDGVQTGFVVRKNDYRISVVVPTSLSYAIGKGGVILPTAESFDLPMVSVNAGVKWIGGITYKYFVSKAWW